MIEEQTRSVEDNASGIEFINLKSPSVKPLCTSAEYPPMKLTPTSFAAASSAFAIFIKSSVLFALSEIKAIGVTEMRLLTIGMPNSDSRSFATFTRFFAFFCNFIVYFI